VTDCDVLICGLGPVGQLLALLLGDLGVSVIAVDQADGPCGHPRASTMDDEVLRIFQAAGVHEQILENAQVQRSVSYITARSQSIEVLRPEAGDLGHPPLVTFHQPAMERAMVSALEERGAAELRWGCRVETIDNSADAVTAWLRPVAGGRAQAVTARFMVGCDGSHSAVRSRLRIPFGGSTFAQRWLVVDALVDRPLARVPHPHFVGDPARPVVTLPMSPGRHRWEWMIHPGEDQTPFLQPARIRELMAPWISGEEVEVERAVVYTFHARTAARWRVGRVFLAGDAAHVMPPFVGQGFSSGARDASNLAWKFDAVLRGAPARLLDSYESERRPHVMSMQRLAVRWGRVVQTSNPRVGAIRDGMIEALNRSGALAWGRERVKPLPAYRTGVFGSTPRRVPFGRTVGTLFPQPDRLDERLGRGWSVLSGSPDASSVWRDAGLHVVERYSDSWLRAQRADWALLRPDRFVYACGGEDQVATALHALRTTVGSALQATRPRTPTEVAA